jgi:hypothetical protein
MTPEPAAPLDYLEEPSWSAVTGLVLGMAMVLIAATVISFAILRASKFPPPTALITALSLLTLFSVAGGIASRNDEAWTIAAAGIGALAGSVTSMFQEGRYRPVETVEKAVAVVQELERQEQADPPYPDDEDTGYGR